MKAAEFTLLLAGVRQIGHLDVVLANSWAVLSQGGGQPARQKALMRNMRETGAVWQHRPFSPVAADNPAAAQAPGGFSTKLWECSGLPALA